MAGGIRKRWWVKYTSGYSEMSKETTVIYIKNMPIKSLNKNMNYHENWWFVVS